MRRYRVLVRKSKRVWTWEVEREEEYGGKGTYWETPSWTRGCRGWALTEARAMAKGKRRAARLRQHDAESAEAATVRSSEVVG